MPDRDHKDRLRAAADLERIAAGLGLQQRGKRFFCPVCQPEGGKTPDLAISDQGFFCHKCGLHGDVFALVMGARKITFPEAVEYLERETGLTRPAGIRRGTSKAGAGIARPGASWAAKKPETPKAATVTPDPAALDAFLAACRPVEGQVFKWLTESRGIAPDVILTLRLRFCGREYQDVMKTLQDRFGEAALLAAGLLKKSKDGRAVPTFWHYYAKKAGFLVIPYLRAGRPVFLKTRPPMDKAKAEGLGLSRFMNTAGTIPCLYNVDALKDKPARVAICEGESDTWAALSAGWAAVGSPGARDFKPAWAELFKDLKTPDGESLVYLVPDNDAAGAEGARIIADYFLKAGLPLPLQIPLPAGKKDFGAYWIENLKSGKAE